MEKKRNRFPGYVLVEWLWQMKLGLVRNAQTLLDLLGLVTDLEPTPLLEQEIRDILVSSMGQTVQNSISMLK